MKSAAHAKSFAHPTRATAAPVDLQRLLQQLELVQKFAKEGFWLTTVELSNLLEIDPQQLQGQRQFAWRNFVCHLVQGEFWQISPIGALVPKTTPKQENKIFPSVYAQIENFLTHAQWQELLEFVYTQESNFVPTSTTTGESDYRRSMILYHFPRFSDLMLQRVKQIYPHVLTYLQHPYFEVSTIECQLTMHNDGNYYRIHNDNGSPDCATRVLTYVYYFYREPKGFTGGELRLYNMKEENGYLVAADSYTDIQPLNNSVVFFLSSVMHEVLPVRCPSRLFADSRFTINGWLRRA
ncbi:MAG: 2OG-Fe(II) oxygenase [Pseudanabaenaceae cyanobacterium SKYGB_i_bin29]|nr:2OG-Fe(II) oxygenase [Pseudanabaenaceae cyanobacterium SKYG29]MDW8421594.1 2OG-Fe(II) oxygenase [Pseudanabaenaceae cyanobacterium SKYGB_i_bin29]